MNEKMREALAPFPSLCEWLIENAAKIGISDMVPKLRERCDQARVALAEPRRNCDVGTAEEQTKRMHENYCSHCECYVIPSDAEPYGCPLYEQGVDCRLKWAQMPYEEGGNK